MDLSIYFEPIQLKGYNYADKTRRKLMGDVVTAYLKPGDFPSLDHADIAIFGVGEERNCFLGDGSDAGLPFPFRQRARKVFFDRARNLLLVLRQIDHGKPTRGQEAVEPVIAQDMFIGKGIASEYGHNAGTRRYSW